MAKRLSNRALEILMVIREQTHPDGRYWLPGHGSHYDWLEELHTWSTIRGAGDSSILRSLKKAGLIERPPGCNLPTEYAYRVTEDGVLAVEKAREAGQIERLAEEVRRRERVINGLEG